MIPGVKLSKTKACVFIAANNHSLVMIALRMKLLESQTHATQLGLEKSGAYHFHYHNLRDVLILCRDCHFPYAAGARSSYSPREESVSKLKCW